SFTYAVFAELLTDMMGKLAVISLADVRNSDFGRIQLDRKSTRLNSSHVKISYAVFCLKKKKVDSATTAFSVSDLGAGTHYFAVTVVSGTFFVSRLSHVGSNTIFFFQGAATTVSYTLSLHDALPIFLHVCRVCGASYGYDGQACSYKSC